MPVAHLGRPPQPIEGPSAVAPSRQALAILAMVAGTLLGGAAFRRLGLGPYAGPASTLFGVALATPLLTLAGESWRSCGLARISERPWQMLTWALATALVLLLLLPPLLEPLANALSWPPQRLDRLGDLHDTGRFLIWLVPVGWGAAAFGEELLYRGCCNTLLLRLLGNGRLGIVGAALGQALLFGFVHRGLGPRAMLNATVIGLVSAGVLVLNGRNLWSLILAHGLVDTVGLTAVHMGATGG
jgi:CAAX protease family protein